MTGNGGADSGVEAVIPNAGASGSGWGGNGAPSEDFGLSLNFGTSPSLNAAEPTPAENDGGGGGRTASESAVSSGAAGGGLSGPAT